ncbi:MAG: ribulose-phosphate 3-epimerase [Treponema sp.]|nr:ribulose-phosphate 3-epimerase [Treponema sp.]
MKPILSPSLLSADFKNLSEAFQKIESEGSGAVHIDVMDGSFVPEITYGEPVIRSVRSCTKLPFDVHLMVEKPENHIKLFADAGADWITFHIEATNHANRVIQMIHELGKKAGVAVNPGTPVSALSEILQYADLILVMTVNPGWGNQSLIPSTLDKVRELKRLRDLNADKGYNYMISVDGGVNPKTLASVVEAGVDVAVSGSAFFNGTLNFNGILNEIFEK